MIGIGTALGKLWHGSDWEPGWKQIGRDLSFVDMVTYGAHGEKVRPGNYESQITAYRDTVFSCTNLNALRLASLGLNLYIKKPKGKKFLLTRTEPISVKTKQYIQSQPGLRRRAIGQDSETEEILDHRFIDLITGVNSHNNQFGLMFLTDIYLELTGNAYWYLPKDQLGLPAEIWILPSQYMSIIPDKKKLVKGYLYKRGMDKQEFKEDEVIHFKFPSPKSNFYGFAPLQAIADVYNIELAMTQYEWALFQNMGKPEMLLIAKWPITEKQKNSILEEVRHSWGGVTNAGSTGLISGEDFDLKDMTHSPREMSFLSGRRVTREKICNAFGVPVAMITADSSYRQNHEISMRQHAENAILARATLIQEKINEKLMPMYGQEGLFVGFDDPVPENRELTMNEHKTYGSIGAMTLNEIREERGYDPVEGGDVLLIPSTMTPMPIDGENEEQDERQEPADVAQEILSNLRKRLARVA